ncbi:MAG TPA: FtsX-like permease family protein [Chloroflexota bacterium]|nr:FtsX-like permease family protein [Chloroflexota bacterium]
MLLGALIVLAVAVIAGLAFIAWRNPLLPRLAWRNVPRRPGFAVLITLGLTIGTVILSSAFTTGDTMSQSVRTVVAGVLGSADEVVFIAAPVQRSGFDLAQSIANGSLLTGVTSYFPSAEAQKVSDALNGNRRVAAVVPVVLDQAAVSSEGAAFAAQLNLLGVPPQDALVLRPANLADRQTLSIGTLGPDEVYINTEAAAALAVARGQRIRVFGLPDGSEANLMVKDITRLGDLGGGQATIFLPLARLQDMLQKPEQVNQVLVINSGDAGQRLASSWPVTVALRSAFADEAATQRLFRALSSPPARDLLARAVAAPDTSGRVADKLRRLQVVLDEPNAAQSPEFRALANDPELLSRLAGRLGGAVQRGNTPFAASAAGSAGFRVIDVQSVAQDQADRWGSAFTDLFVVLGAFSLFSGMLLIVLVFSLVALERRTELGITRALGARRRDVVLLLALEGGLYSVISSLFGLGGGLALALGIIALAQGLVEQYGFHLEPVIDPSSIAASYGLGVVLTFVAVSITAWRSSRFSIVTAIRDLPDPPGGLPGWRGLVVSVVPAALGPALIAYAIAHRLSLAYAFGVASGIIGLALLARWALGRAGLRGPERVVFTLAGVALIGWWLLPVAVFPAVVEMSFLSGVTMLLGAVWVLAYNVGVLRRLRAPAVLWRLSTAYVAANRFRTGLTLTMFALVVLSLTVSAVLLTATRVAYADPDALTGGWDIHAVSSLPPRDLRAELTASGVVSADAFAVIGGASPLLVEGIQTDVAGARWAGLSVLAVDAAFIDGARTPLVGGDSAAWRSLTRPGTAIAGAGLLKAVQNRLQIKDGEGSDFRPTVVWLRDPRSAQRAVRVDVVGVADARGPFGSSLVVNAATLAGWPPPETGGYYLAVPSGANARELAAGLNVAASDLKATTIGDELRLVQGVRGLLNIILQGFMGVGLLAGVAALGTLSTRAVVERRRQIGVLRALGVSARNISLGLLAESAVVALLGAGLGVGVGLFVAQSTVTFLSRLSPELRFAIPWEQIALVVVVALGAALLMTLLPARQAARLSPAEALRDA